MCEHKDFHANIQVTRLEDTGGFIAGMKIQCRDCGKPFQFLGLKTGCDTQGARISIDGLEANIAICPQGSKPNPLQRMAYDVEKFDG
jgi:hypothetical protein